MLENTAQQRARAVFLGCAVLLALTLPANAAPQQAPRPEPAGIRLTDALSQALRGSPRLFATRDAYDQATVGRDLAASRFNLKMTPYLSAGGEPYSTNTPTFGVNVQKMLSTGATISFRANSFGFQTAQGDIRDYGYTFRVSQPIFEAFGPEPTYELTMAKRAVDTAAREVEAQRQVLVLETAQAYFAIVRQQKLVEASEVALDRAHRLRTASDARRKVGLATQLDVLRADLFVSQAQASLEDRQTALADARDTLKLLMGRSVSLPLEIAGDDLDDYVGEYIVADDGNGAMVQRVPALADERDSDAALVYDAATQFSAADATSLRPFIATALGNRLDVINARSRVEDAELTARVATWRMLPTVNLNASYSKVGFSNLFGPAYDDLFGGWSIGISTAYELDRSDDMAAFSSASISARSAQRALVDLTERVTAEVRRAHRAIGRAEKSIVIQQQAVEFSEGQLELAQLRYERGLADNFDIVDAESNLFNAQSALVSARVDRAIAGLALELSMGLMKPENYIQ